MKWSERVLTAIAAGVVIGSVACTGVTVDDTKKDVGTAVDATRSGADRALATTQSAGEEVTGATKTFLDVTGAEMTDGWITAKVKAKFSDEIMLNGSDISVNTDDHVVTLTGTVASAEGKTRAAVTATGTEGVKRVVDQLVVR